MKNNSAKIFIFVKAYHLCGKGLNYMFFSPEFIDVAIRISIFAFLISSGLHLLYVLLLHTGMLRKKKTESTNKLPPVSVIVCARNESENLYNVLPKIINQNYPNFEVIVVNHQSVDDSKFLLHALQQDNKNLRVIEIARNRHLKMGKKLPLSLGIKGAKHEHLVFTDADCEPTSSDWLMSMAKNFSDKKKIVLGYGPYSKQPGILNALIRFDTTWIAMNYFGAAKIGIPYMGVGRNLAYTKTAYKEAKGFKSHFTLLSGDDDLFIQDAANKTNVEIEFSSATHAVSSPKHTWGDWLIQKKRHWTTAPHYKVIKKLVLGTYPLTLLMMLITFVILLLDGSHVWLVVSVFSGVHIVKWIVQGRCFAKLNERSFNWFFPFAEWLYFLLLPLVYFGTDKKGKERWR
ncbi:MAG: glycosyltransferase involved in cell wall biosynthesis [Psychromonas sp.]